jgi:D-lyxose ketol-isomerase
MGVTALSVAEKQPTSIAIGWSARVFGRVGVQRLFMAHWYASYCAVRDKRAVLMLHRRMQGKMTAYGKRQSAAEGLRLLALRYQRRLHLR